MELSLRKIWLLLCISCCSCCTAFAQPRMYASIDRKEILIGEQLHIKVTATLSDNDYFVTWLKVMDSLPHFELIDQSKIDSVYTGNRLSSLSQTLTFTSFDSGKWSVPPFEVSAHPLTNDTTYHLLTDSFPVTVSFVADSTNELRDIKPIRSVEDHWPWWYWAAGAGGLLLLVLFLIWFMRKKPSLLKSSIHKASAYEQAIRQLEQLQPMNLTDPVSLKQYHSGLTEVLKQYLAARWGYAVLSSTTSELLVLVQQHHFSKERVSELAAALRCSDAVKFARYIPGELQSKESWQTIRTAIDFAEQFNQQQPAS